MFLSHCFCEEGPTIVFFSGFPDFKPTRFERNCLEFGCLFRWKVYLFLLFVLVKRGGAKSGWEELKEELLQLEDEYEALHHKQALTFDKQNRDIFRGSRWVIKKTSLFGLYTWWNPIQYKKDYKKPYNQGNRTVSN